MNVERGIRRLLVVVTAVLAIVLAALRVLFSSAPVLCTYMVGLADGTMTGISAPPGATGEQVQAEARRLHPETKTPVVVTPRTGDLKRDLIPPAPDEPAVAASCADSERTFARLTRYAYEVIIGVGIALLLAAVMWTSFFVLRWVARRALPALPGDRRGSRSLPDVRSVLGDCQHGTVLGRSRVEAMTSGATGEPAPHRQTK